MDITASTILCAVIGHPIGHSFSPVIHNAAYRAMGVDAVYTAFDVAPQNLARALEGMRALGIRGLSVTIPHKEALLPLLDEVSPTARAVGAANTVVLRDGRLIGHTTDGRGAYRALAERLGDGRDYDFTGKTLLFLGAGGAARSLVFHAIMEHPPPAEIIVLGRTAARAEQLARDVAGVANVPVRAMAHSDENLARVIATASLAVNCTPLGMHPRVDATPIPKALLERNPRLEVFDTVYNPLQTRLLTDARALGLRTAPGIDMLIHQAAAQVELFLGQPPPIEVMRAALTPFFQ